MERIAGMTVVPLPSLQNDILISVITSASLLVKEFGADGSKKAAANMYSGILNTYGISHLANLQQSLTVLSNHQCLCLGGVQRTYQVPITTEANRHLFPNAITRSKKYIHWMGDLYQESYSILFFDFDFSDDLPKVLQACSFNEIRALLLKTIPALAHVQMLIRWSSSSNIIKADGTPLNIKTSMHIFVIVKNATANNIEGFKEYLYRSLWANGFAYCVLSKGDQVLQRSFIDMAVLSPERIIITASPILPEGWYKAKKDEHALYEGGALDLEGIDHRHLPDWHPSFWDAKFALEAKIERVSKPKRAMVVPNNVSIPFVASASLNDKLELIEEKLHQGGKAVSTKQLLNMIDGEVTRCLLQGIGYSVDENGKFKIRDERTASTSIRADGFIKDFGGDFGGNIINFLIDICGLSYKTSNKFVRIALGGATHIRLKPSDYEPLIDPNLIYKNLKGMTK